MIWDKEFETLPRETLESLQLKRLKATVGCYTNPPQKTEHAEGVDVRLPEMKKKDGRLSQNSLNTPVCHSERSEESLLSMSYKNEILRSNRPQNNILGQPAVPFFFIFDKGIYTERLTLPIRTLD